MTFLVGLPLVGLGLWLLYDAVAPDRPVPGPRRPSRTLLRLQDLLVQAGLERVRARDVVLLCAVLAALGGLVAQVLLGWPLLDLLAAALGALAPLAWLRARHAHRRAVIQRGLADAIGQLRDAVEVGGSLEHAFVVVASRGPEPLRPFFAEACEQMRFGFSAAVLDLQDRLADPVFDLCARSLLLQAEVGGTRFRVVLRQLAEVVRRDIALRDRMRAARTRIVYSARILCCVPLAVLALLRWWSPVAARVYDGWDGQLLLCGCALAVVAGYGAMLWLGRLPGDERVLVR